MKVMMTVNAKSDDYEDKFLGEEKKHASSANLCLVENKHRQFVGYYILFCNSFNKCELI